MDTASLKQQFADFFGPGGDVRVVRAPGRVNLIGEHTDYNDGFVFPMAIEQQVMLICRSRDDAKVVVKSSLYPDQPVEFSIKETIKKGEPAWGNYVRGPIALLQRRGMSLKGMDCLIVNTLPPGGGLSSSAAMEVGTIRAMLALIGQDLPVDEIAKIGQLAEHEFAGVPCGIMDQAIVAGGKAGHAMMLDCRDHSKRFVEIDPDEVAVIIVNSMVKHELSGGEYAERRQQCEQGVAYFRKTEPAIQALRDVHMMQILNAESALGDVVFRRCRHVVSENQRCLDFAEFLEASQYTMAGRLMEQSHNSLRDDYEVSTPELDFLVKSAMSIHGVYGSRMTGGGFGGCTVSLVEPGAAETFAEAIRIAYQNEYKVNPTIFATAAADGASVV
ncbi:MAG TPA: galactokinase [Tepidisphaeraceae bacterium]